MTEQKTDEEATFASESSCLNTTKMINKHFKSNTFIYQHI